MNLQLLQSFLTKNNIQVVNVSLHSKASEKYIEVSFQDVDERFKFGVLIPFHYRRTGLFIDNEQELANYLEKIKPYFEHQFVCKWIESEKALWEVEFKNKMVTKPFFDELIKLKWTSDFPQNPNAQRRLQDIKELGYTIASRKKKGGGNSLEFLLLPIPRGDITGYEQFSTVFRKKALDALNNINAFELSTHLTH